MRGGSFFFRGFRALGAAGVLAPFLAGAAAAEADDESVKYRIRLDSRCFGVGGSGDIERGAVEAAQGDMGEDVHALIFRARVGDREVEGLDLVRPGPDGRIVDFTVMVRPLTGVVALAEAVGPQLAAAEAAQRS